MIFYANKNLKSIDVIDYLANHKFWYGKHYPVVTYLSWFFGFDSNLSVTHNFFSM